jgi:hypothetical protein
LSGPYGRTPSKRIKPPSENVEVSGNRNQKSLKAPSIGISFRRFPFGDVVGSAKALPLPFCRPLDGAGYFVACIVAGNIVERVACVPVFVLFSFTFVVRQK